MRSLSSRLSLAAASVAVAAVGIAACSPPQENPSETKVDTATSFAPPVQHSTAVSAPSAAAGAHGLAQASAPLYADCANAPIATPMSIQLSCFDATAIVSNIQWTAWDAQGAEGDGMQGTVPAHVELTNPVTTGASTVFSTLIVNGEVVAP
ncbi:hypothetical protein ACUY3K_07340 [Corynebacterium uberis]|uniref:hypothetical protein n=1 Tax=Corynebacterium TaxID=1716 RepID=UPI001D0A8018|nr:MULTISPECIES: hypothetical protein [Corynebacterium]MCZ9308875.1 hypothetical protein [Corynebacterium sp. c6VSa_13]UDL74647.1 hypothetical protein LH391_05540 [Corynebacterium uberis]UDL76519.1 hypothetical protein LH393_03865 [Corynebacterium uberis]UDL78731.1 hypothetical protein LH394_03850 [Corynebacterium uberis]UDL81010.1 hypothetical protein LH392_04275 [Corynebacterium uberis]